MGTLTLALALAAAVLMRYGRCGYPLLRLRRALLGRRRGDSNNGGRSVRVGRRHSYGAKMCRNCSGNSRRGVPTTDTRPLRATAFVMLLPPLFLMLVMVLLRETSIWHRDDARNVGGPRCCVCLRVWVGGSAVAAGRRCVRRNVCCCVVPTALGGSRIVSEAAIALLLLLLHLAMVVARQRRLLLRLLRLLCKVLCHLLL